ncbi:MAG: hypothetical protein EXR65_01905 [Dehalococcoidia bacterium]|nr:hypothetical protein [Dehalococcoidia bacterium]
MPRTLTLDEIATAVGTVTSASDARAVVHRALQVAGVPSHRALEVSELLLVCQALAAEGGPVQQIAELIAMRALER